MAWLSLAIVSHWPQASQPSKEAALINRDGRAGTGNSLGFPQEEQSVLGQPQLPAHHGLGGLNTEMHFLEALEDTKIRCEITGFCRRTLIWLVDGHFLPVA